MDGGANQSERTSQHEQFLAPLRLEIPSFPPLTVDDSSEWRAQVHEASAHLIPPITSPSKRKRKGKTAGLAFSPGASKSSFRRESSPAPTASSIASEDRKGSQDSMSRTPTPGPQVADPSTSKRNSRTSVFREDSDSPSHLPRDQGPPAQSSTTRHYSNKPLPAIPSVTSSPVQERHSQLTDSLPSATDEQIAPARERITLLEALALGFDNNDDGTGTGGLLGAKIDHERRYTNAHRHSYSKAQTSRQTRRNSNTVPAPPLRRRLSLLVAKIYPRHERKRSIRYGKRRSISGPLPAASTQTEAHLRRSRTVPRFHSTGEAHYPRTQRPLTSPTTPGLNDSANDRPSRRQLLDRRWSRKAGVMRLGGSAAVQRALVISDVTAVERWEWPMRQYPSQNGVTRLAGPVEHTEKLPGWMARGFQEGEGRGEKNSRKRERERKRRSRNGGFGMLGVEADLWRSRSRRSVGVANTDGAINRISSQRKVCPEKMVITTSKVIRNSPNDSGHGGEGGASSNTTPNDKTGGGGEAGQPSPADSGYSRDSKSKNSHQPSSNHSETTKRRAEAESHVISPRLRNSIVPLRESYLDATAEEEEEEGGGGGGGEGKKNEMALREKRNKDVEDELFAEELQLRYLKEQHLSWWEKSPSKPGAFRPVRQRKAVRERGRWRSRIPAPVAQPAMGSDELMSSTPEHRLSHLEAARKDVIDYAGVYEDFVEDCITSLTNISISPSINRQLAGPVWPASGGSSRSANTCASRIISSASGATTPEVAELKDAAIVRSWPGPFHVDSKPPPIPERSSRRVKSNIPFREHTQLGSPCSSEADVERYVMTPTIYGHYVAVQRELNKRFDAGDFSSGAWFGRPVKKADRQSRASGPLHPERSRQRRKAGNRRNAEHMIENLRYPSSDDGEEF